MGNISKNRFNECWNSEQWIKHRKSVFQLPNKCEECSIKTKCHICPAATYLSSGSFQKISLEGCSSAFILQKAWNDDIPNNNFGRRKSCQQT